MNKELNLWLYEQIRRSSVDEAYNLVQFAYEQFTERFKPYRDFDSAWWNSTEADQTWDFKNGMRGDNSILVMGHIWINYDATVIQRPSEVLVRADFRRAMKDGIKITGTVRLLKIDHKLDWGNALAWAAILIDRELPAIARWMHEEFGTA